MKVYTQTKKPSRAAHLPQPRITQQLTDNINQLTTLLTPALPAAQQTQGQQTECLALAAELASSLLDPSQSMLLYPLVVDFPCSQAPDPLFVLTNFPTQLHPLLTLHLNKATPYLALQTRSRTLIDLFYLYCVQEHPCTFQKWLQSGPKQSLGEWFYSECVGAFCQTLFKQKDSYTLFVVGFLQQGVAYLLTSAAAALKKESSPPALNPRDIERVEAQYVARYWKDE